MANKISGRIITLSPTQTLTSNNGNSYNKRDFVIERIVFDRNTGQPATDPSDTPIFSLIGENCKLLDNAKIGDEVTVDYELRGRSYQKDGNIKYFNDIRVSNVVVKGLSSTNTHFAQNSFSDSFMSAPVITDSDTQKSFEPAQKTPSAEQLYNDDLPF